MATIVGRKKKGASLPIVVSTSPRGNNPQCIVLPIVTGTATIGSTVSVSQGTWLNNPGTFYYQWQRNLSDIPGAVFTNYILQSADLNQSITCLVTAWNINGNGIARTVPFIPIAGGGTAPILSSPTATATSSTTATLGVTTDTGSGTLYWVLSTSSTPPSATQIIAGQDSTGSAAARANSQAVSVTGAQSVPVTGLLASTTYFAFFVQSNGLNSNVASATSFTTSAFATPSLTNSSALGTVPVILQWSTADYVVGDYGQIQIASDNAFTTITQNIIFFIDGASWASLDESIGLQSPAGTYFARIRVCQDNDSGVTVTGTDAQGNAISFPANVSPWSNTFSDTINVASAVWNSTTGVNKSQYLTISGTPGLIVTGTSGVGTNCGVRTTTSTTGKRHFEITYTTAVNNFGFGIDDGTTALGPAQFNLPNPGVVYRKDGNIYVNGTAVQTGLATMAQGDVGACEFDTTAGTVKFFKNGVQMGTTITGVSFSAYYGYCMTYFDDVLTGNFGENAFSMTPTSGFAGW